MDEKLIDQNFPKVSPVLPSKAFGYIQNGAIIVDIRAEHEINYRVIDCLDIIYLSYDSYKENYYRIPKEKEIVIVDNVGLVSPEVGRFLISKGYNKVFYISGGIIAWDHAGMPLKKDVEYELNGGCACRIRPKNMGTNI
jgi:rhodanese-related sulfurtransferase